MKGIEQKQPTLRWADKIEVTQNEAGTSIRGLKLQAPPKMAARHDLLEQYLRAVASDEIDGEQNAPHYLFANSLTRADLTLFLEHFGPFLGEPTSLKLSNSIGKFGPQTTIEINQDWEMLRVEHRTFVSLLRVYQEVHSSEPDIVALAEAGRFVQIGTSLWEAQAKAEEGLGIASRNPLLSVGARLTWDHRNQNAVQGWVGTLGSSQELSSVDQTTGAKVAIREEEVDRAVSAGHMLICEVLNAFPTVLTRYAGATLEVPTENVLLGVRHVVYFLLRQDYLKTSTIARCAYDKCRRWYVRGSQKSPCCPIEGHAQKYASAQWYLRKGKALRKENKGGK